MQSVSPTIGNCVISYNGDFTAANGSLVPKGIYIARITVSTTDGQQLAQTAKIVHN